MAVVIQLSDLHLMTDAAAEQAGVPVWRALDDVLEQVDSRWPDFDRLVITGDVAHDEIESTYAALAARLGPRLERCRIIAGNHDHPPAMRRVFQHQPYSTDTGSGFGERVAGWWLIGLDSHIPGEVGGRLGPAQLGWLESQLQCDPASPAVLFVHHPPIAVGRDWSAPMVLEDASELMTLCDAYPNVKLVCSGHVHQEASESGAQTLYTTAPSTAYQFTSEGGPRVAPDARPGFRWIQLNGTEVETRVERLPGLNFPPSPA